MAYIILAIFTVVCTWKIIIKKGALPLVILYFFIAPNIPIGGGLVVDSSYVFIFILLVVKAIVHGGKVIINRRIQSLLFLIAVWIFTYTIGWFINGAASRQTFIISILGLVKTLAAVGLCLILCNDMSKSMIYRSIGIGLSWTVGLNAMAVILQYIFPYQMYDLCHNLYYSASSSGYTSYESIESWGAGFYNGRYYRYFGLNETPMVLSCIIIVVLAFLLIQVISDKKFFTHPRILGIVAVLVGVSAQCKIFFLMLPVLVLFYVFFNSKKMNTRQLYLYIIGSVLCLLLLLFLDDISSIAAFRYLHYITSPLEAFVTRFGDGSGTSGYLTETLTVALDHLLTGVGPISISGEPIADNSFVVILHNGGIVATFAMVAFYTKVIFDNYKSGNTINNILILAMIVMGLSRTNLIFGNLLILTIFYVYVDKRERNTLAYDKFEKIVTGIS